MSITTEGLGQIRRLSSKSLRLSQAVVSGIVALCDVFVVIAVGLGLFYLFLDPTSPGPDVTVEVVAVLSLAFLLLLAANATGLYRFPVIMEPLAYITRFAFVCVILFLILVAAAFALKISGQFSRVWAFSWLLGTVVGGVLLRVLVARALEFLARAGHVGRTIVLYGAGVQGQRLLEIVQSLKEPWNQVAGVFDDRLSRTANDISGVPVLGNLGDLVIWSRIHQPDEILIALPWGAEQRVAQVLQSLVALPANVRLSPEFTRSELLSGRLSYQFGVPMLSAYEKPLSGWGAVWKSCTDLVLAALFLVLAAPIMLIIAICIRLESPGPVLFRQPRYGFNNELIDVYKFRTMNAAASDPLANRLTERGDSRVTRVGAFLRRTSLDELPQLFNVLRGEMSVVGPRPHAIRTAAGGKQCDEVVAQYAVRHKVKPGITGWAQVNGWRGTMETEEALVKRLEHDLYYINHWSPWFDIAVVVRTFWTVLQGRNSY